MAKLAQQSQECALTKQSLQHPIVVCRRGLLYNKEALMRSMIEKNMPYTFRHIRKLSNLVTLSHNSFDNKA